MVEGIELRCEYEGLSRHVIQKDNPGTDEEACRRRVGYNDRDGHTEHEDLPVVRVEAVRRR